ncbi:MAG: histidine phosphatase family protein [Bacillus sp. (in: Bacteria)]|nr:histidine phosphatase family protein [Bacillus sp. (in: firmicutes)]
MKRIYLIRHCEAEGQPAASPLTEKGFQQATELVEFFRDRKIDRIIASPYLRAVQTIQPLAEKRGIEIETDTKLTERVLSTSNLPDWLEKLEATYGNMDLKYEGGESSSEARERIIEVVEGALNSEAENIVLVTHGNILSLLLNYYDTNFGFQEWKQLSNPDIFLLYKENNKMNFQRLWG